MYIYIFTFKDYLVISHSSCTKKNQQEGNIRKHPSIVLYTFIGYTMTLKKAKKRCKDIDHHGRVRLNQK